MSANTFLPPSPVVPPFLIITGITNAVRAVVTVSTPNTYIIGQVIYFSVPFPYGMFQINALTALITAVDVTNLIFTTDMNTTQFDPFIIPSFGQEQPATLSPSGARNIYNTLNEPFHAKNGQVGN